MIFSVDPFSHSLFRLFALSAFCNSTCGLWNMEWSVCQKFLNLRFAFKNFEMEDNLELHSVNSTVDSIKTEKTGMREKISVSFAMCCHFISWKKVENWKYCWNNVGNCPRIWPFRYVFQDKGSYWPWNTVLTSTNIFWF